MTNADEKRADSTTESPAGAPASTTALRKAMEAAQRT